MTQTIPGDIAHLDFEPDTEADEEITRAKECEVIETVEYLMVFRHRRPKCRRVAAGTVVLRCCMAEIACCRKHYRSPSLWLCPQCGQHRGNEWARWKSLDD